MADWDKVLDLGNGLPDRESRADAVAGLCDALRSPDPALRDEHALTLLASWIPGLDKQERHALGDIMAARFGDEEIQARAFAPLILAEIVAHGEYDPRCVRGLVSSRD
jgi:hypothetical protein